MLEALNFFKPISSVPYEELPENYQEINNPVNIKSVHFKGNELKVDLGKKLYFDTRLSKNGTISCNSCHNLNTFGWIIYQLLLVTQKNLVEEIHQQLFMLHYTPCNFGMAEQKMLKNKPECQF